MIEAQMKKIASIISFSTTGIFYLLSASASYAASSICPTGSFASLCTISITGSSKLVSNILTILLVVGTILALFFLIYGGIRWITSGGDKAKLDAARGTISAAVIGLIVALLAFFIISTITFLFTGKAITSFTIPTLF